MKEPLNKASAMKTLYASIVALTLLAGGTAASAAGIGVHVGGIGIGVGVHGHHHGWNRHHGCRGWGYRHHHRYCRGYW